MIKLKKIATFVVAMSITFTITGIESYASTNVNSVMTNNQKKVLQQYQGNIDKVYNSFEDKSETKVVKDPKAINNNLKVQEATDEELGKDTEGVYPTRSGVILVTRDTNILGVHYGHAGIVWTPSTTVEAQLSGVGRYPNTWQSRYKTVKGITVKDTTADQDKEVSDWCNNQVGKPYNYNFFNINTRSSFYCSQLVWAAYKDLYGMDIDPKKTVPSMIIPVDLPKQADIETVFAQWDE
ncbi:YiiX/YebB-like N1pC/P60 family cysteine hydrolase [Clostridium felsineum]|uniref:YiiX/YebB-like N1pC/P60 family cysteine hydrolase n=1 Tax=Clostridium felsineum TaxID=36839 RepID=UPI00098BFDD1|nr:YiiX/YebB-like N1pC/P60 family cysteine hydrolase [Clostridium felsineum]URZ02747.1 hypothetical protein CLAUR_027720 [Clostridium felsineum]